MIKLTAVPVISLVILMTGCGSDSDSSDAPLINTFEVIACPGVASNSSIKAPNVEFVTNSHKFVELYLASNLDSQQTEPVIDFEKKSVIGIHLGEKPSSGYQVKVTGIEDRGSRVIVSYEVASPSEGCEVNTALTYPYCFVSINKSSKTVEYSVANITKCSN
jgi:hypothetical protein